MEKPSEGITKLSQDAKKLSKRIEQTMTPAFFLANIVNLKYRGKDLTDKEIEIRMDFATSKNSDFLPFLVNFKAEVTLFQKYMFHDKIVQTIKPCVWWKFYKGHASSAGVERIFSSFGLCIQILEIDEIDSELRKQANWFSYSNYLIRKHWNQSIYWIESLKFVNNQH